MDDTSLPKLVGARTQPPEFTTQHHSSTKRKTTSSITDSATNCQNLCAKMCRQFSTLTLELEVSSRDVNYLYVQKISVQLPW